MYTVYIIQNPQGILYKGHTNNLERRIREHNISNSRFSRYTKNKGPWKLIYQECFSTRKEAMKREKYFKTGKGREELIALKSKNKNAAEVSTAAERKRTENPCVGSSPPQADCPSAQKIA